MRHKKCRMTEDRPNRSLSCPLLQLLETDRQRGRREGGGQLLHFFLCLPSSLPLFRPSFFAESPSSENEQTFLLVDSPRPSSLSPPLHLLQQLRSKSLLLCATLPPTPSHSAPLTFLSNQPGLPGGHQVFFGAIEAPTNLTQG